MQKPSQKHKNLTFEGRRFRSPLFLQLKQILKAVAMGVVASIEVFWSNMANPAMTVSLPKLRHENVAAVSLSK
jgi:hypothetical protein